MTLDEFRINIRRRTSRWDPAADVSYGVAESTVDSGNLLKHPWKRARTTFQYLAVAILGRPDDRAAFREAVNTAHRHVKSASDSPIRYNAFDRELQMSVTACLFVGLEDTYQPPGRQLPVLADVRWRVRDHRALV